MTDVTDNFNRADGGLGTNWINSPDFGDHCVITSNEVASNGSFSAAYWSDSVNTFSNDQHAECTIGGGGGDYLGPVVRHDISGHSNYYLYAIAGGTGHWLFRVDNGGFTSLNTAFVSYTAGDTLRLTVSGSTLTLVFNGATIMTFSDATYSSGQPGIFSSSSSSSLDNFSAGPIVVSAVEYPLKRRVRNLYFRR